MYLPSCIVLARSMLLGLLFVFNLLEYRPSLAVTTAWYDRNTRLYKDVVIAVSRSSVNLEEIELLNFNNHISQALCNATGGRAAFGSITLLRPRDKEAESKPNQDAESKPNLEASSSSRQRLSSADFRLGYDGPQATVVQSKGCHLPGDFISINPEFVNSDKATRQAHMKHFLTLWFRHRYGVFPEMADGTSYDVIKNDYVPNTCTDSVLEYHVVDAADRKSTCTLDPKTGSLDPDCTIVYNAQENSNIKSSLLFNHEWDNIHEFCNHSTHNPYTATPQNLLCGGKSVWEVVEQHQDFTGGESESKLLDCDNLPEVMPITVYANCRRLHVLIALNRSSNYEAQICHYSREALLGYVYNLAEQGTNVSFYHDTQPWDDEELHIPVTANRTELASVVDAILNKRCGPLDGSDVTETTAAAASSSTAPSSEISAKLQPEPEEEQTSASVSVATNDVTAEFMTTTPAEVMTTLPEVTTTQETPADESKLYKRVAQDATSEKEKDSCFSCAIEKILQEVKAGAACDNTVLIVTDLEYIDENANLTQALKQDGVRVLTVSVNNAVGGADLEFLAEETLGRSYSALAYDNVMEESSAAEYGVVDALFDYSNVNGDRFVLVNESKLKTDEAKSEFLLKIEPEIGIKTYHLQIHGSSNIMQLFLTEESVATTAPLDLLGTSSCFRPNGLNTVYCAVTNENKEITIKGSIAQSGNIYLRIFGEITSANESVVLTSWLSNDNKKVNLTSDILYFYAHLTIADYPVLYAFVEALVTHPNGTSEFRRMTDDGLGADILKNDGVYTGYMNTCQERGRYSFMVNATGGGVSNVCSNGASQEHCEQVLTSNFTRISAAGSAFVDDCGTEDVFPPFMVRDLSAIYKPPIDLNLTSTDKPEFWLSWTDTVEQTSENTDIFLIKSKQWPLQSSPESFTGNLTEEIDRSGSCKTGRCKFVTTLDYGNAEPNQTDYLVLIAKQPGLEATFISNVIVVLPFRVASDSTTTPTQAESTVSSPTPETPPSLPGPTADNALEDFRDSHKASMTALIVSVVLLTVFGLGGIAFYFFYYRPKILRRRIAMADHSVSYRSLE